MELDETRIISEYFINSTKEHLNLLGVDPARIFSKEKTAEFFELDFQKNLEDRLCVPVIWEKDNNPIGFSTTEKITFGDHAFMHLHILDSHNRKQGIGTKCVFKTIDLYFNLLRLNKLYCEPNANNKAPNNTLLKAGFTLEKTYQTVPSPLNYRQTVNRWVIENKAWLDT